MSVQNIRWAILGTSPISHVMAKAITESSHGEVYAVLSRTEEKAKTFAATHHIPHCYTDIKALLKDPNIDAVYIGLPNHLHKEYVILAANARKHILCEKPFTTNLQDAQDAFVAVHKANVFCMEALMYRSHPFIARLAEVIQNKVIGDIKFIHALYSANIKDVCNDIESGSILNLGCYPISLIRFLVGCDQGMSSAEPIDVLSLGEMDMEKRQDCRAGMIMRFTREIIASVMTANDMNMTSAFDIYGTQGQLKIVSNPFLPEEKNNRFIIQKHNDPTITEVCVDADKSLYTYQIDLANQHILNGSTNVSKNGMSWFDSLGNVIVLEAWRKQVEARYDTFAVDDAG